MDANPARPPVMGPSTSTMQARSDTNYTGPGGLMRPEVEMPKSRALNPTTQDGHRLPRARSPSPVSYAISTSARLEGKIDASPQQDAHTTRGQGLEGLDNKEPLRTRHSRQGRHHHQDKDQATYTKRSPCPSPLESIASP